MQAASSIIYATPYLRSKGHSFIKSVADEPYSFCLDLDVIRNYLVSCFGSDFARSAVENRYHQVSSRVLKSTSTPIPSAFKLDNYLQDIAKAYGFDWLPEPRRQEMYLLSYLTMRS